MRKIVPPPCDSCGLRAEYESTELQVRVCYRCLSKLATWAYRNNVIDSNPLLEELLAGVFTGGIQPSSQQYNIWVDSPDGGMRTILVTRCKFT